VTGELLTDFVARELYSPLAIRAGRGLYTVVTSRAGVWCHRSRASLRSLMEEFYVLHRIDDGKR
jgi:hypothetical protein